MSKTDPLPIPTSGDDALAHIFLGEEGLQDPSPYYRYMREEAPMHRSANGAIFLSQYDDCREVLRDNRLGKSTTNESLLSSGDPEAAQVRKDQQMKAVEENHAASMLFLNPPAHTRQRALVSRAFTPRRVEVLRASIRTLAEGMVDEFVEAGGGDLLDALAFPLPVAVIGTMVGVPEADWPQFRSLITATAAGLEPAATADDLREGYAAHAVVRSYFQDLVAERKANPADDLLSGLIQVADGDDRLSDNEIVAVTTLLFAAGFETTTNMIGNGMGALLRHPDQMARLWNNTSLLNPAVEEMLRWDSPVQLDGRTVLEPAEVAGEPVEVGTRVMTLLGAANRDPKHFEDPECFDITRDEGPPMSFGSGIHYCLGANLARAETQELFGAMIKRCKTVEQTGELRNRRRITLRGYLSVPVAVTAS
ncbi:cytochrome P450 [bacterium]|jgi:cytochrome P450|nr:cytochrome P450 [Acidimicrobiales bacterium]MDC1301930.1 cytochrome P450 [bacterium]